MGAKCRSFQSICDTRHRAIELDVRVGKRLLSLAPAAAQKSDVLHACAPPGPPKLINLIGAAAMGCGDLICPAYMLISNNVVTVIWSLLISHAGPLEQYVHDWKAPALHTIRPRMMSSCEAFINLLLLLALHDSNTDYHDIFCTQLRLRGTAAIIQ